MKFDSRTFFLTTLFISCLTTVNTSQAGIPLYHVDLISRPSEGQPILPWAINSHGDVAGMSYDARYIPRAMVWDKTLGIRNLDAELGGTDASAAYGINNAGQTVGAFIRNGAYHAFVWDRTHGAQDIGEFDVNAGSSIAYNKLVSINNQNIVVGGSYGSKGTGPFIWDNTSGMQLLNAQTSTTFTSMRGADGINDSGDILGWRYRQEGGGTAAILQSGILVDTGVFPGGFFTGGESINNLGHVVGIGRNGLGNDHAFYWENGSLLDLGAFPAASPYESSHSNAYGLNNLDQVVGENSSSAFLWQQADGMLKLDNLIIPDEKYFLGHFTSARGINDAGQIIAIAGNDAYLLTPVPVLPAFWLLGSGLVGLAGVARRRKASGAQRIWTMSQDRTKNTLT